MQHFQVKILKFSVRYVAVSGKNIEIHYLVYGSSRLRYWNPVSTPLLKQNKERERERKRERGERETHTDTERDRERETEREKERQRDREREREMIFAWIQVDSDPCMYNTSWSRHYLLCQERLNKIQYFLCGSFGSRYWNLVLGMRQ